MTLAETVALTIAAEHGVVGSVFRDPTVLDDIDRLVRADDFLDHRTGDRQPPVPGLLIAVGAGVLPFWGLIRPAPPNGR